LCRPFIPHKFSGKKHRFNHTAWVSDPPTGNVEGCPVIHRSSNYRKTERHVNRFAERQTFYRYQSLIVIASRDGIELTTRCSDEQSVSREGPRYFDVVVVPAFCYGWRDLASFFQAEQPVLSGVRVEPGYGNARLRDPEPAQLAIGKYDRARDTLFRDRLYGVGEADVNRQ
jgi:hypothetical protein